MINRWIYLPEPKLEIVEQLSSEINVNPIISKILDRTRKRRMGKRMGRKRNIWGGYPREIPVDNRKISYLNLSHCFK